MEESWTDERFRQVDERFDRLEASIATLGTELRSEIRESSAELRQEIQRSNTELRKAIEHSGTELRRAIEHSNAELRAEIRHSNAELRAEIQVIDVRTDTLQRTMLQIGGGLIGTMIVAFSGLIATQI